MFFTYKASLFWLSASIAFLVNEKCPKHSKTACKEYIVDFQNWIWLLTQPYRQCPCLTVDSSLFLVYLSRPRTKTRLALNKKSRILMNQLPAGVLVHPIYEHTHTSTIQPQHFALLLGQMCVVFSAASFVATSVCRWLL